ncbi:MAG: flavodoxin domain-containing protein [Bacillota bacterium]|nr:flavodoxin domain-containing protein [Bacillota bacterium]MDW7678291.1 flavodoxin domain-containing protein [Bacillota bacterium]
MKPIQLVYRSKTGFTKKYAEWIGEELKCEIISIEMWQPDEITTDGQLVFGGGLYAGRIQGLKELRRKVPDLMGRRIVVFATGGAPFTSEGAAQIKKDNFTDQETERIPFFYFQSGLNYEKMGLPDKAAMKLYSKMLQLKSRRTTMEEGANQAILTSYDHSSRASISPLIDCIKLMQRE